MQPTSILLVDDDALVRSALTRLLKHWGYRAVAMESGEAALSVAKKQQFDLAIVDRNMPGMDGIEVLQSLREIQPMCSRILLTGNLDLPTTG